MSFVFCSGADIIRRSGAGASSVITSSGSAIQSFSDEAEGRIISESRQDFLTYYSSLPYGIKQILKQTASCIAAQDVISYDVSNYLSGTEAQTILDVLENKAAQNLRILKDFKSATIKSVTL